MFRSVTAIIATLLLSMELCSTASADTPVETAHSNALVLQLHFEISF
jgi:hypothetical protein